jgi:hypothetical protein
MGAPKSLRPRAECLESRIVMSAGGTTAAAMGHARVAAPTAEIAETAVNGNGAEGSGALNRRSHTNLNLSGAADGEYTSTYRKSATKYHLSAAGTISPVGSVGVRGSFHAGSKSGQNSGSLTIVGVQGTLTLQLRAERSPIASESNGPGDTINQGMPTVARSPSTVGDPIILVNDFAFTITGGTGKYANDRGAGSVEITTAPGLTSPSGPGIYSSTAATDAGVGQTTITFGPVVV